MLHTLQTKIYTFKSKTHVSMDVSVKWHSFQNHVIVMQGKIQFCKTAYCIFRQECYDFWKHSVQTQEGSPWNSAKMPHIFQRNATMFAKGCCIHGGIVFFMQNHFKSGVCMGIFPSLFKGKNCINWCLFSLNCILFLQLLILQTMHILAETPAEM